jgi:DNA-binding transcriptional regulator YdaS (Cro superfamily)
MARELPRWWAEALVGAGFVDPRYEHDVPSISRLAEEAGLHTTTVSRMIFGRATASARNVEAVANALGLSVVKVSGWVDQARTVPSPYQVPDEVHLLTERQQKALTELIRSMAAANGS